MSLLTIFREVSKRVPSVEHKFGASGPYQEDGSRRIVWVPSSETLSAPQGMGGDPNTADTLQVRAAPLWTRESMIDVHIWGRDSEDVEVMLGLFVNAAHDLLYGSYELRGGEWVNNDGQTFAHGQAYVLGLMIKVPITRPDPHRLKPTQYQETTKMDFLDGSTYTDHTVTG